MEGQGCHGAAQGERGPHASGLWTCAEAHPPLTSPSPASCFSLRVSRGASGGDGPALLGQGLSRHSPLTTAMSKRQRKTRIPMKPGESKVSLPQPG